MSISRETFKKEIKMCQELAHKNGGKCQWGECDKCGVIPLLYKLSEGKFLEDKKEIKDLKKELFS
jgi:hypothetical protein